MIGCSECEKLKEQLGLSRHFEHEKLREIREVDEFIASKYEAHDGNFGRLVDRVKLLYAYREQEIAERIKKMFE